MKLDRLSYEPRCVQCRALLDGYTGVGNDEAPETGSVCICLYCSCVHIVEGRTFRRATIPELESLEQDADYRAAVYAAAILGPRANRRN